MVEVIISKLGHDGQQKTFVVVLQEKDGTRVLPIWIGRPEAESIAAHMHGVPRERPMTHDLAKALVAALDGTLTKVVVTRVEEPPTMPRCTWCAPARRMSLTRGLRMPSPSHCAARHRCLRRSRC